jgi:hypothetical protein
MQISSSWKSPCSCQRHSTSCGRRTASIWIGLFRKERQLSNSCYRTGILASEWLSQRPLPPCFIPAQHRGIPSILQCLQEVCAMVGHGQGSNHDPECMAILCSLYILHLADIVTVQRRIRGYNHRKLFAQKYEERQQVSLKRINNNLAHCTSNVCFEVILRGLWIVDWWGSAIDIRVFRGHLDMVACRRLTSAIAIQKFSEVIRRGLRIVVWRAKSPFKENSEVIRWGLHIVDRGAFSEVIFVA